MIRAGGLRGAGVHAHDPRDSTCRIDPARTDLAPECRAHPSGPHGEELRYVLHRMHTTPPDGRYCAIVKAPFESWVIGRRGVGTGFRSRRRGADARRNFFEVS